MPQNKKIDKLLVIKLSALGDFIQALGPMAAIRSHHPEAHITLMTTNIFKIFGEKCEYFDEIWIDKRPSTLDIFGWINLRKKLLSGNFSRVYDLQNNDRTNFYLKLFPKKTRPEWIGAAKGASHRNNSKKRIAGHAFEGHKQTLSLAGINDIRIDDLSWVAEDLSKFNLKPPFIILIPGSAPQHLQKRWPEKYYTKLAQKLNNDGYQIILIGTEAEKKITGNIAKNCDDCLDLTGKTSLLQIAALARKAYAAIGNDTGPMHLIGSTGCKTIVLFSAHSNPERHAPKGDNIYILQENNLNDLEVSTVSNLFDNFGIAI